MIPNATKFLSSLPGTRVTAVSGGVTAPLCIREAIRKMGHISDSGLAAQPVTRLLFLTLAFGPARDVADLIRVNGVPAVVTSAEIAMFDQIVRADVLLLSDTCQIAGASVACQINAISRTTELFVTGAQEEETETLTTHVECLAEPDTLPVTRDPIIMPDGTRRSILSFSLDNTGRVLSIRTTKRGTSA
jgi:hypothetical protein